MKENGNEIVKMLTPEPMTPATTNKETGNTRRGNKRGNFRRGNKVGLSWSEQNDFKGETLKLNAVLRIVTKRLEQRVTFDRFQDVLKNYVLKNSRKAEGIVEIITDMNDPVTNFEHKQMPDDITEKEY